MAQLLRVKLHNSGNMCYINASIYATAWSVLQLQLSEVKGPSLHACYNALLAGSAKTPLVKVMQLMPWRLLLGQWAQPSRQHDICEFLHYLIPRCLRWPDDLSIPKWEARRFRDGRLCTLDSGSANLPIPLPLCQGAQCHLQWCIDGWHIQSSVHALLQPAPLVCLQLLRFHNEDGVVRRDPRPLIGHLSTVHLPVYKDGTASERDNLECTHIPYQVVALALHYGASPTEGHYRAVLRGQQLYGAGKSWITDDNSKARSFCTDEDTHANRAAAYVVWLAPVPGQPDR